MTYKEYRYIEKTIIKYWSAVFKGNQKRADKIVEKFIKRYTK